MGQHAMWSYVKLPGEMELLRNIFQEGVNSTNKRVEGLSTASIPLMLCVLDRLWDHFISNLPLHCNTYSLVTTHFTTLQATQQHPSFSAVTMCVLLVSILTWIEYSKKLYAYVTHVHRERVHRCTPESKCKQSIYSPGCFCRLYYRHHQPPPLRPPTRTSHRSGCQEQQPILRCWLAASKVPG